MPTFEPPEFHGGRRRRGLRGRRSAGSSFFPSNEDSSSGSQGEVNTSRQRRFFLLEEDPQSPLEFRLHSFPPSSSSFHEGKQITWTCHSTFRGRKEGGGITEPDEEAVAPGDVFVLRKIKFMPKKLRKFIEKKYSKWKLKHFRRLPDPDRPPPQLILCRATWSWRRRRN